MSCSQRFLGALVWGVVAVSGVAQEAPAESEPAAAVEDADFLEPSTGSMSVGDGVGFGLGTAVGDPTALFGPTRREVVLSGNSYTGDLNLAAHYIFKPAEDQRLLFEVTLDPALLGTDISYSWKPHGWDGVWTGNFFLSSGRFSPYAEATPEVLLPNGEEPFLQQGGGGLEYVHEISESLDLALGVNYQNYAFSDELLGGNRFRRDLTGTPLALGDRSTGDLYTTNLHGRYSTLDDRNLPTEGTVIRFGAEQAFGLGNTSTSYTRLAANASHLFRAPGFNDGPHSFLVNLQGGTLVGNDSPQVRGFHLGGPYSVRGYEPGEIASGSSFLQGTLEYRHHLRDFMVRETDIAMRAAAFVDYGTVLGTEKRLRGIPEYLWDKSTEGTGYGIGLHFGTEFGLFRLETAWSNRGDQSTYLVIGERF